QEITEYLTNARKQLLAASYQAMSMNEARIENNLAKRVIDNPNELSGARPAGSDAPPANANTNVAPAANTNANAGNAASNTNAGTGSNAAANSNTNANR